MGSIVRSLGYRVLHRPVEPAPFIRSWPRVTRPLQERKPAKHLPHSINCKTRRKNVKYPEPARQWLWAKFRLELLQSFLRGTVCSVQAKLVARLLAPNQVPVHSQVRVKHH